MTENSSTGHSSEQRERSKSSAFAATNQLYMWDFRMNYEYATLEQLQESLPQMAKKWVFQLEKGEENGYMHWQGRMSLHKKMYQPGVRAMFKGFGMGDPNYCQPTHDTKSFSYVMKVQTRVDGPFRDDQDPIFVADAYKLTYDQMHPYQKVIYDSIHLKDWRHINYVYCPNGNIGKSTICGHMGTSKLGIVLPPFNDGDKVIQYVCSYLSSRKMRDPKLFFFDLPRSMNQYKMAGIYKAIEQIKIGIVHDTRYGGTEWYFQLPIIWVFSNAKPYIRALSMDRWLIWSVNEKMEFEPIDPKTIIGKRNKPEDCPILEDEENEENEE